MSTQVITKIKELLPNATLGIALAFVFVTSSNAAVFTITGSFQMFGPTGDQLDTTDTNITGSYDDTDPNSMLIGSPQIFFGFNWFAHDLQITQVPGVVTVETCPTPPDGSVVPAPDGTSDEKVIPCTPPLPMSMTIGPNQWGVHMLFDWNTSSNIDVLNVWNVETLPNGSIRLTSTDYDGDGIRAGGMQDGAFQFHNANFDLLLSPPFLIPIIATQNAGTPILLDPGVTAGGVSFDATVSGATVYDWSASDAAILAAATTGTSSASFSIDQTDAGLIPGSTYTLRVSVTKDTNIPPTPGDTSDDTTSSAFMNIRVANFLLTAADTDADSIQDDVEGFIDTDGDNIPEYLDASNVTTRIPVLVSDTGLGEMTSSEAIIAMGGLSLAQAINTLTAASNTFGTKVTIPTIGSNDDRMMVSCIGGCFDFKVKSLSSSSVQVVLPLTADIPVHPILRKVRSSIWTGFQRNDDDKVASAAAISNSPVTCPAAGSPSYVDGLTPGHRCVQMTITDGGSNDGDGTVNNEIGDLTVGVAKINLSAPFTRGVGSISWLLLTLLVMLGVRRTVIK